MRGGAAKLLGVGLILVALATLAFALEKRPAKSEAHRKGLPTDWSHRHLIFSQPRIPEQAARLQSNTRYLQQEQRRTAVAMPAVNAEASSRIVPSHFRKHHRRRGRRMHRDWAEDMGPGATLGADNFPAKYSFDSTVANCAFALPDPDFVIYPTGLTGSTGQASVVTYTNLYSGCAGDGPVPAVYWAYNTGGAVNTSPLISLDGTQVAFTQTSGGIASLVLLKWFQFTGQTQTPDTLTPLAPSSYFGCTAPCITTLALGASNDTNSSVFYDYDGDAAYVGDDSGKLHKFSPVFAATPAEVTTGGWPVTIGTAALASPLFDSGSGNVFVTDGGGFLYSVSSSGVVTRSGQLDYSGLVGDGPMLDVTAGLVYVFSANDNHGSAGLFQLATSFVAGATGSEETIGASTIGPPVHDGGFDFNYLTSSTASGNLYVCGDPGGEPTVYKVPIQAGVMAAAQMLSVVSTTTGAPCSPLTDVYNPLINGEGTPTEWVFLSTQAAGSPPACDGFSCVMSFKTTSWLPSTVYNLGQEILDSNLNIQVAFNSGGTSGAAPPVWNTTAFQPTSDGGVIWRVQGPLKPPFASAWAANTLYPGGSEIFDSNNNIELTLAQGTSGSGSHPTWATGVGDTTLDGTVFWFNMGLNPIAGLSQPGGTSGIIIDNTSNIPGASQVYFSTLAGGCGTDGTGGCAVQASQQGLQ